MGPTELVSIIGVPVRLAKMTEQGCVSAPINWHGVIVVDKPEEWTSHDVVAKMRRIANTRKIGHLGTLDPIATGVLPLVIGRATRLAQFYTRSDKIYEGVVRFGWSTTTYDRAGERIGPVTEVVLDAAQLENLLE